MFNLHEFYLLLLLLDDFRFSLLLTLLKKIDETFPPKF